MKCRDGWHGTARLLIPLPWVPADVDTVWLRNPLPYMKQYPDADVLTSSDHLSNTVTDEGLELWPQAASAANIGIMLFRPRANALAKVC